MHGGTEPESGYPRGEAFSIAPYQPGLYTKSAGTVFFTYSVQTANVVERNNLGHELVETGVIQSNTAIALNREVVLARWNKEQEVEQTIGVPFLSDIPFLKYLFSTTTVSREKTAVYMTVRAEMMNTALPQGFRTGELKKVK